MWKLFTYINCWHLNGTESEAMWRIYCPTNEGIALKTTYAKLAQSIESNDFYLGLVRYIDYRSQFMPLGNAINPLMHKRKAFEHEREVRALKIQPNIIDIESVERDFDENKYRELNPEGIKVPIDIASTFDAVYVDPYAPKWYFEVVKEVLNKFSITIPLEWSQIADKPNY